MKNNTTSDSAITASSFSLEESIEALFHDESDLEGNPGLSVWDVPSSPSKKAVKRRHDDMAKQHEDPGEAALPSSSPLPTPTLPLLLSQKARQSTPRQ
ncbi:hypothetical protein G6514_008749 [Epicoccum nigrum]|nr:hypothetical protein G6514_008749 [Epicoccum nigrum]